MKLAWIFMAASLGLFLSGVADADDRAKSSRGAHKSEPYRHYHEGRHHREHRRHHHHGKRHRHHHRDRSTEIFLGGLVLGSAAHHTFHGDHGICPDRRRHHRGQPWRHYYWSNRYGECFRIERRRRGDVYVEVPRHKCY